MKYTNIYMKNPKRENQGGQQTNHYNRVKGLQLLNTHHSQ